MARPRTWDQESKSKEIEGYLRDGDTMKAACAKAGVAMSTALKWESVAQLIPIAQANRAREQGLSGTVVCESCNAPLGTVRPGETVRVRCSACGRPDPQPDFRGRISRR